MITIIYHYDNTRNATIAECVSLGAVEIGVDVYLMNIEKICYSTINKSDAIIFGCPTYFGSPPAAVLRFLQSDETKANALFWKDKIAAGFTDSSTLSGDKLSTLMCLANFALSFGMIWIGMDNNHNRLGGWVGLMVQSKIDKDSAEALFDNQTAIQFGRRIAKLLKQYNLNKRYMESI